MPGMIKAESSSSHSLLSLHSTPSPSAPPPPPPPPASPGSGEERGIRLIQLLYLCADAVSANNINLANLFMEQLSALASITGDPIQRVATYFMQALATRITKTWPGVHRALRSTSPPQPPDLSAARQILFSVCPYLKFAFLTVNQTLLDAMQGEKVVHLVDLQVCGVDSTLQWLALLQAFGSRAEGPPHLRFTAVNSSIELLSRMGQVLSETAERLDIPFQYHPLAINPAELNRQLLRVKSGEAVAVTSVMQLHRLLVDEGEDPRSTSDHGQVSGVYEGGLRPKEKKRSRGEFERTGNGLKDDDLGLGLSVSSNSPTVSTIDRVLSQVHGLAPKVLVVVEQESPHNGPLHERFAPALHYYSAIFDLLNSALPQRGCGQRLAVERLVFGQEIENLVACEGRERVERHECLESWRRRLEKKGFSSAHLSPTTAVQAERLLTIHSPDGSYKLQRGNSSLTLCWQDTPLLSVSSWASL